MDTFHSSKLLIDQHILLRLVVRNLVLVDDVSLLSKLSGSTWVLWLSWLLDDLAHLLKLFIGSLIMVLIRVESVLLDVWEVLFHSLLSFFVSLVLLLGQHLVDLLLLGLVLIGSVHHLTIN